MIAGRCGWESYYAADGASSTGLGARTAMKVGYGCDEVVGMGGRGD